MEEKALRWLPEDVIHHVFSYLNDKKQAQTSAISKNWQSAWRTNPRLNFDDGYFNVDQERFRHYVNNTLTKFKGPNIAEFNLSMAMTPVDISASVDRWLNFALEKGVKVLQVTLPEVIICLSYVLPSKILKTESLTTLCVTRCKFPVAPVDETLIMCKNLRVLHLVSVYNFDNQMFNGLISACPLISDLRISDHYDELNSINVSNLVNLKQLCIEEGYASETRVIEVDLPNVETIEVILQYGHCTVLLHACPNLKSLSLANAHLSDEFCISMKDKFPRLECLQLTGCYGFNEENLRTCKSWKPRILSFD